MINPYEVLGVERTATPDDVKRAYRRLALEWHPDRNRAHGAVQRFQAIAEAYAILSDPNRRATWHTAETDAWFDYIYEGVPLPWDTDDVFPWDDESDLPF